MDPFVVVTPWGAATITFEVFREDGRICCGVYRIDGRIKLPPKAWLRLVRAKLSTIEQLARDAGCAEMRVAGRDWSRVLPDWSPLDGVKNGLRKVL